jgi:UDP-glucose 4-epimerase
VAGRRILITGIASHLGTELARRLETDPQVEYVAGLDSRPPRDALESTDFIEVDLRSPTLLKLIPQTGVDTVVHNQIIRQPGPGLSSRAMHDINVIGSLQLLAAAEKTPSVRSIVIRGSAGIYGSEPAAPQFFTEEMSRLYPLRTRFQRDVGEIENYFETFSRRHPRVTCTMLRYQTTIGPSVNSQITRYLALPVVPTYLGFDPRMQFVHERDAIDALVAAVKNPVRGAVNVAAPGTMGLAKMIRLAGKASVPLLSPAFGPTVGGLRRFGLFAMSPDFQRLLRYGRAVDITRLTDEVGFQPQYTMEEAIAHFVATQQGRRLAPTMRQAVAQR